MHEVFRKRRGPQIEEIEKVVELKEEKGYRGDGIRSFREFIRQKTDYAPSTVYTYIKLYKAFGKDLQDLGLSKARLLLRYGKTDKDWIERAKTLTVRELEELLRKEE
ncbi:MAG: hypothetical protein JHC25_07940 [Thermodesulfobacterium sp.]|jgi:hypothetical protein|nr:hypothetical protein [Thermodesulfobacterium sp.]